MGKIYSIVKHKKRRCTIRISFSDYDGWGKVNDYNQSIEDVIDEMVAWCKDSDCGRRVAYDMFAFRNLKELSMFLLRWA